MAGIRAEKGFKVSKIEFPAITGEFPSQFGFSGSFSYIRKVKLGMEIQVEMAANSKY